MVDEKWIIRGDIARGKYRKETESNALKFPRFPAPDYRSGKYSNFWENEIVQIIKRRQKIVDQIGRYMLQIESFSFFFFISKRGRLPFAN